MLRRFSAVANVSLAVAGSVAVLGSQVAGIASGVAPVAYQNTVSTVLSINVIPRAKQGSCVDVRIAISSDGGQPTGTMKFSIDGAVSDTRAVPASGILNESINCGSAGTAARLLHARAGGSVFQSVAYTLPASAPALSVGTHTLQADYVPTGNFAPASKSASIDIYSGVAVVPGSAGFPHGVDAGLASLNHSGAGVEAPALIGGGVALALALGATSFYRRRATR